LTLLENPEALSAWTEIRAQLKRTLGESAYEIWIEPLQLAALEGHRLLLSGPAATQTWVASRFGPLLDRCARAVLGDRAKVAILPAPSSTPLVAEPQPAEREPVVSLNPRYSFEQFIIGDGNRLAHAAALAVAELPGQAYNPLFLHSPPGLGKTHLLHAIGNYLAAFGGARVRYTTAETFTNHFIHALASRSLGHFKQAYREVDVLLLDDVHFLASKARTEEEFFHTFDALYQAGRQLVLTCDRMPSALANIEERLRERFQAGLVADIKPPDLATRVAILRKRTLLDAIPITDESVLEAIARRVTDNVRALEGALIRVVAYHSLTGRPIDLELVDTVLQVGAPNASPAATLEDIQAAVAAHFKLTPPELASSSRAAMVAWPRQVAIHLARQLTSLSLQEIGAAFGGRNHATVLYALRRVRERLRDDPAARADVEKIAASLPSGHNDRMC
jgi:chromosomal replication initiator protein